MARDSLFVASLENERPEKDGPAEVLNRKCFS